MSAVDDALLQLARLERDAALDEVKLVRKQWDIAVIRGEMAEAEVARLRAEIALWRAENEKLSVEILTFVNHGVRVPTSRSAVGGDDGKT